MTFEAVLAQVLELLQRQGWASQRTLRRRFGLDAAALAALMQQLVATQPVAVDEVGARLVWQGELRPAAAPTQIWDMVPAAPSAVGATPWPLGGDRSQSLSPLVGREHEIRLLRARWEQVQAGQGQVVALSGEAGIGKSRLVQVLTTHVAGTPHRRWACRGVPTAQYSAFAPVIDLLQQVLDYQPDDPPATKLCQQMEDTPHLLPVLGGVRMWYFARGDFQAVSALGEQFLRLAQRLEEPTLLLEAYRTMGFIGFFRGTFALARTYLEQGIDPAMPPQHPSRVEIPPEQIPGPHPAIACLVYIANVLWALGYPEQALQKSQESVRLAQSLFHPSSYSVVFALDSAAVHAYFRRDRHAARQGVEAAMALPSAQEFTQRSAMEMMLQGWEWAIHGQAAAGIAQIRQSLEVFRATGAVLFQQFYLALFAEACGQGGQIEDGLTALAEALALVEHTGERWWEAEIYRLKGELLMQRTTGGRQPETVLQPAPEECFHRALDIARTQQAKSLELRAAMSLSRLWQRQGKRAEARELLAPIYGWFTEGFDAADLQEARALLETLE